MTELIYGLECTFPDHPPTTKIDGYKLPVLKQKFRRTDWESVVKDTEDAAEGIPAYNDAQIKFIHRELDRCENGYWFMNKGKPVFLTGKAYFYYNYWWLENKILPEYRDSDRKFFLFFETCQKHPQIKGLVRIKNRRLGATSMGAAIETHIAIFNDNKKCGIISKTDTDARKLFQDMIVFAFYRLPLFLRPRVDTSSTNKNELHFIEPAKRGKGAVNRKSEGRNSKIDYQPTSVGSYDSTRLSFAIVDEGGKWEKVNILSYHDVIIECVSEGAKKKGFLYMPSTVNEPKKGGANFKVLWDNSNQFQYGLTTTPTGMVRFFIPSYECMAGFFDEYGMSVVEPPDKKTLKFLIEAQESEPEEERVSAEDLAKGARIYLDEQLSRLTDDERRDAFKRKYPIKETDSFSFGSTSSPFNTDKIQKQIDLLMENPEPLRQGRLYYDYTTGKVDFADDKNGKWFILKPPTEPNAFAKTEGRIDRASPTNGHKYKAGIDTFRFDKTQLLGSNGVIWIGTTFDSTDDSGGELVAFWKDRPSLTELMWKECLLAGMWYGAKLLFEKDATQEYKKYFNNTMPNLLGMNCDDFLHLKPNSAIDPNRKTKDNSIHDPGVSSADPFTFAKEIELGQLYVEKYVQKIKWKVLLEELLIFDVDNRTEFDAAIGWMVWLLGITGETKAKKTQVQKEPYLPTYRIEYKSR